MNDSGNNAKQQIVEKIKDNSNILVTVNTNPTVDELTAALGLTMMLNKIGKHTTAVVSGELPRAIDFLEPGKTFENTVDSLRDFIIALDKEKADHLRYKVDGDVVKIFITPYRTTIGDKDLDFSQGDYNVEFVVAIGVNNRDELDKALSSHGRILHDATVSTLTLGDTPSDLGSIDWMDGSASSYSEMLVSLSEAIKTDKAVLDEQIATALLTGIVSATDRFSNDRTSSKVMTMSAQLMGAGANQQLIASKLSEAHEIGPDKNNDDDDSSDDDSGNNDGTTDMSEGESSKIDRTSKPKKKKSQKPKKKDDGALVISHEKEGDVDEVREQTEVEDQKSATDAANESLEKAREEAESQQSEDAAKMAEDKLEEQLKSVQPEPAQSASSSDISVADLQKDLADASAEVDQAAEESPDTAGAALPPVMPEAMVQPQQNQVATDSAQPSWQDNEKPSIGGTLNATTEQAAEDSRREATQDVNRTILKHDSGSYVGDNQPTFDAPLNATNDKSSQEPTAEMFDPTGGGGATLRGQSIDPNTPQAPEPQPVEQPQQTLADLDNAHRAPAPEPAPALNTDNALDAVNAAYDSAPFNPAGNPVVSVGAQPLGGSLQSDNQSPLPPPPPMPDFSTLPPPPPVPEFDPGAQPSGALPPDQLGTIFGSPDPNAQPLPVQPAPQSNDPAQFQIPGQ